MKKERLIKIIERYLNHCIDYKDWKWVSLDLDKAPHYLFRDRQYTIITAYSDEGTKIYRNAGFEFIQINELFWYARNNYTKEIFSIFGEELYPLCCEIFINWVSKKIPLDPSKTDGIGGKKRILKDI